MPRDATPVLEQPNATDPPFAAKRPTPSGIRKQPVMLFDPYSQKMIVCTRPDDAAAIAQLAAVPGAARGPGKALRLLQLALLSSVGVVIWFMISLLQTTY